MGTCPFEYAPLDRDKSEFRLLTLQTDDFDSRFEYSLSKASLKDDICFNALSYTWGSASEKSSVIINGDVVEITTNLESALRHIRNHEKGIAKIPLWIDAICINQLDTIERNRQVQMMKQIYRGAWQVLIWLGEGDSHCDWVFQRCNDKTFLEEAEKAESSSPMPSDELVKVAAILDRNLMRKEWWNRMWVIQETVLAKQDPFVICGHSSTSWKNIIKVYTSLKYIINSPTYSRAPLQDIPWHSSTAKKVQAVPEFWDRIREDYQKSGSIDLSLVFALPRFSRATDPRDYVYGCLGLLNSNDAAEIDIDYRRHPVEVYRDTVLTMLRRDAGSYLRNCIILFPAHAPDAQYPSWVPSLAQGNPIMGWQHSSQGLIVAGMATWRTPQLSISNDCNRLAVAGIRFDEISEVYCFGEVDNSDGRTLDYHEIQQADRLATDARKTSLPESHTLYQFSWLRGYEDLFTIFTRYYPFGQITADDRDILWSVLSGQTNEIDVIQRFSGQGAEETRWRRLFDILYDAITRRLGGRKLLISKAGFVGLGVPRIEKGDIIVYIFGMHCPLVVRAQNDGNGYVMVGFAYISGLMDLNLLKEFDRKGLFNHLETTLHIY